MSEDNLQIVFSLWENEIEVTVECDKDGTFPEFEIGTAKSRIIRYGSKFHSVSNDALCLIPGEQSSCSMIFSSLELRDEFLEDITTSLKIFVENLYKEAGEESRSCFLFLKYAGLKILRAYASQQARTLRRYLSSQPALRRLALIPRRVDFSRRKRLRAI